MSPLIAEIIYLFRKVLLVDSVRDYIERRRGLVHSSQHTFGSFFESIIFSSVFFPAISLLFNFFPS